MVKVISKYKMLAMHDGRALLYHKGKLYSQDLHNENEVEYLLDLPISKKRKAMISFRLIERLLRMEPRLAVAIDRDNFLMSCAGKIFRVDIKKKELTEELQLRSRMNNPLMFAKKENGNVLFGEYFSNNDYEEVCVFERESGFWKKVYSFPAGSIYHIHGITVDRNKIYILTGDKDKESAIWYTQDDFEHVEMIVGGSQKFRACVAYPYQDGLLYATDTPLEQNYLYTLTRKKGKWIHEVFGQMPGPCIYGTARQDGFYFATSVEPDASLSDMRYRFSYKLGKGVKDRYTHIIRCTRDGEIMEIAKFKKDLWPMLLFQFGNCLFPNVELDDELFICPQSVKRYDGRTVKV